MNIGGISFFWGKNTNAKTLELKMHPELTEAIGSIIPRTRRGILCLYERCGTKLTDYVTVRKMLYGLLLPFFFTKSITAIPGISSDDILLMQYEVQTRSQKVYGQDVNANTITQICNADERGHRFNYLRDIYKYYRVSFPGEFEGERRTS